MSCHVQNLARGALWCALSAASAQAHVAFLAGNTRGNGSAAGLLKGPNGLQFGHDGALYVTAQAAQAAQGAQGSVADGLGGISHPFDSRLLRHGLTNGVGRVFAA
jgi:hypothetical protein